MDTKIVTSTEQKVFWSKSSIASFAILVQTVFLFDGCLLWLSNFVLSFSFSHKSRKRNGVKFSKTGPSKVCGRQPLKNYTWSNLKYFPKMRCMFSYFTFYRKNKKRNTAKHMHNNHTPSACGIYMNKFFSFATLLEENLAKCIHFLL